MKTGEKIKQIRTKKKITQKQLAEMINKSIRTVQKYESGEIEIPLDSIYEISKALQIDMREIYYPQDEIDAERKKIANDLRKILNNDDPLEDKLSTYRPLLRELNITLMSNYNEDNSILATLIDNKDGYTMSFTNETQLDIFFEEIKYTTQCYINRLKHFDKMLENGDLDGK